MDTLDLSACICAHHGECFLGLGFAQQTPAFCSTHCSLGNAILPNPRTLDEDTPHQYWSAGIFTGAGGAWTFWGSFNNNTNNKKPLTPKSYKHAKLKTCIKTQNLQEVKENLKSKTGPQNGTLRAAWAPCLPSL